MCRTQGNQHSVVNQSSSTTWSWIMALTGSHSSPRGNEITHHNITDQSPRLKTPLGKAMTLTDVTAKVVVISRKVTVGIGVVTSMMPQAGMRKGTSGAELLVKTTLKLPGMIDITGRGTRREVEITKIGMAEMLMTQSHTQAQASMSLGVSMGVSTAGMNLVGVGREKTKRGIVLTKAEIDKDISMWMFSHAVLFLL